MLLLLLLSAFTRETMAKWFRSEDMAYVSIIVNEDAAHTCISDLGKLGMIQFTDLNPELTAFQRRYVAYIKRIDELERKLSFFGEEVRRRSTRKNETRKTKDSRQRQVKSVPLPLALPRCRCLRCLYRDAHDA